MTNDIKRQEVSADGTRTIAARKLFDLKKFMFQWEWILILMLIAVNVFNMLASPNYASAKGLLNATRDFLDKAIIVFPMAMVLMIGEIDISVASTMALSATMMGVTFNATQNMGLAILVALLTGTLCGFINGIILAKFPELSSMIVTLSTQIIFRGIAQIILETKSIGGFPLWFREIAKGKVAGLVPYTLLFVIVEALFFAYLLHFTRFGRNSIAMGNSVTVAKYSGVNTNRNKVIIYTLTGLLSAVAVLYLASKMSSVRSDVAKGYELDIIAMAVLGGISTSGGKGRILGASLAILIIGFLRYGLGLINATPQIIMVVVGLLLIAVVSVPTIQEKLTNSNWFKKLKR